ncbi:uncharacterized protein LOC128394154 [Panonychus citri]|uniref:uncharacterized protein LOC128394154 n=1 Tax=Panonychus citri TaxID=50023 RepID=UPI0023072025|nr:uncharacterized protein LOC128394154 [Panonychus citri]
MFISTQIFLLIVTLFVTLSIISATSSSPTGDNDVTTNESDSALANKNADDVFRQMVYKAPGSISMGRLAGQSNMREEVQKFREFLQTRRPQPSDWVKFKPPTTTTTSTTTGTTAPPNLSECFIEIQEIRKVPGRCIKLGGRIPACQSTSSEMIDINYVNC